MSGGRCWSRCFPTALRAEQAAGLTTARWSTGSSGAPAPALPGAICRPPTGPGSPSMTGIVAGQPTGPGTGCCTRCAPPAMWTGPPSGASGRWPSTRPSCALISTPPVPAVSHRGMCPPSGWRRRSPPARGNAGVRGVNTGHLGADDRRRQASRDREALGRSRGGLSTTVHLLADARSRPLGHLLSSGQRGDTLAYEPLMARLTVPRRRPGPARTRPDRLLGDKAYSATRLRADLRRRKIRATIPVPDDQVRHRLRRGSHGGDRRVSTPRPTRAATPSSARSTSSRTTGPSPCAPTSAAPSSPEPSPSRPSASGSATSSAVIAQTGPSTATALAGR
jgi:hypothetical protein